MIEGRYYADIKGNVRKERRCICKALRVALSEADFKSICLCYLRVFQAGGFFLVRSTQWYCYGVSLNHPPLRKMSL